MKGTIQGYMMVSDLVWLEKDGKFVDFYHQPPNKLQQGSTNPVPSYQVELDLSEFELGVRGIDGLGPEAQLQIRKRRIAKAV